MIRSNRLVVVLCLVWWAHTAAYADVGHEDVRGELLYTTHCSTCHAAEIHWREQKLVTDWSSLKVQVRRWQANIGLIWSEGDVDAVARFLNNAYYSFPAPIRKDISQGNTGPS